MSRLFVIAAFASTVGCASSTPATTTTATATEPARQSVIATRTLAKLALAHGVVRCGEPVEQVAYPPMIGESVIRGIVTDYRQLPVVGAKVVINTAGLYPGRAMSAVTDEQGRYTLLRVAEGTYHVDVFEGTRLAASKVTVDGESSVDLDVVLPLEKPGDNQTVTIDSLSPSRDSWTSGCISHDVGDFPPYPMPQGL